MTHSKRKGIVGEREAAKALGEIGVTAERAQQYSGFGSQDLKHDLEGVHIEVKYASMCGTSDIRRAVTQAGVDAGPLAPVVLYKIVSKGTAKTPWLVIHTLKDWRAVAAALTRHEPAWR
jgi:hypothetical protein